MIANQAGRTLYFELSEDAQQRSGLGQYVYTNAPIDRPPWRSMDRQLVWLAIRIWEVADGQARFLKNRYVSVALAPDPEELTLVMLSAQRVDSTNLW